ncbi:MAG: prolyl oligopeptidase family serine peptidase [Clostridia bacterium]|nr:prolyl oligopeptidase family serine peptidase [Clostridia bacterium]
MAFITIEFLSEILGRQTSIDVIIPQRNTNGEIGITNNAKGEKYKTLVLLHGLSDNSRIWMRRTCIDRYATEKGIAVVMPSGDRSFYTNMYNGDRFADFIGKEVLAIAREYLPLSDKREDTFIAGNSMGGYGAMKMALKFPETFSAAAGLSSVADVAKFMEERYPLLGAQIFGEGNKVPDSEDLFALTTACESNPLRPRLYMIEGLGDFMLEENRRLQAHIKTLDYDFTYEEYEGIHDWAFWDTYIQKVLAWMFD